MCQPITMETRTQTSMVAMNGWLVKGMYWVCCTQSLSAWAVSERSSSFRLFGVGICGDVLDICGVFVFVCFVSPYFSSVGLPHDGTVFLCHECCFSFKDVCGLQGSTWTILKGTNGWPTANKKGLWLAVGRFPSTFQQRSSIWND